MEGGHSGDAMGDGREGLDVRGVGKELGKGGAKWWGMDPKWGELTPNGGNGPQMGGIDPKWGESTSNGGELSPKS